MRILVVLLILLCQSPVWAQLNELALVAAPLDQEKEMEIGGLYLRQLNSDRWQLRAGLNFSMDRQKEIRADEVVQNDNKYAYRLSMGVQRNVFVTSEGEHQLYAAGDAYWNSAFSKPSGQDYFGYFYDFGVQPILGYKYLIAEPIQVFAELRADLNVNLQEYSGDGENYDRRVRFASYDHLAIGLSYWF